MIPKKTVMTILRGHLKGFKWIKGSHNFSVILGSYEQKQTQAFVKQLSTSKCFVDLGAHVGYYTLIYRKLNSKGQIFSFEPLPENVDFLNRHIRLNNLKDIEVINAAVSDVSGSVRFNTGKSTVAGKLDSEGNTEVPCISFSDWINDNNVEPDIIKMDIEGEEYKVLKNVSDYLQSKKPKLLLSTHGAEVHKQCFDLLKTLGYENFAVLNDGENLIEREYFIS